MEDHFDGFIRIGDGKQAEIFRAVDRETGMMVAVKKFREDQKSAFTYEVEALRWLHPHSPRHVVPLKLVRWEKIAAFPYYKNGELYHYIQANSAFDEVLARTLFSQLLTAIRGIHLCGVIHRDIKPENILIDDDYNVVLVDFGFAELIDADSPIGMAMSTTYCGSIAYMAPQMFIDPVRYDGRQADVWSAGCVLFSMVTGNNPFVKASRGDWWFNQLLNGRRARFWEYHNQHSLRPLSAELIDFIDRILVIDETERATIEELQSHPWMRGDVLTNPEIVDTMSAIGHKIVDTSSAS
jgi:serine/threonine protein kinase